MTVVPDPLAALRIYLIADPDVNSLVDGRVWGGKLDEAENKNMRRANLVLVPAGGPATLGRTNDFGDMRIDTICYAEDEASAWMLYRTVLAAMKRLERQAIDGVLLHWAKPLTGGATGTDPLTNWPSCLGSFHVLAAEVPAD